MADEAREGEENFDVQDDEIEQASEEADGTDRDVDVDDEDEIDELEDAQKDAAEKREAEGGYQ
ncbi:hypothetical protein JQK15_25810 [Sphingobium sp. BHU LFT2]|uniref:hypothetical protein n=1 Tax=Sphingobium sp. BHU LFT2 TaxID=2807634 RepID=UPI001BE915EC|nr:hypothetical protein [Sphingobium sp. BHU LFT2]MBT2246914.1 hypothetical protein [Sphingobium sp. BHU LFT2]